MHPSAPQRRPRPRAWMLFFALLGVLGVLAIFIPLFFNLSRQLRPEQVAEARQRWRTHGPDSYDLHLLVRADADQAGTRYHIAVRDGRVMLVGTEKQIEYLAPGFAPALGLAAADLPARGVEHYRVGGLFDHIEATLNADREAGVRNYCVADFHRRDGHPTHFVHRVRGTRQRLEWIIRLEPPGKEGRQGERDASVPHPPDPPEE